jgi:hypothetical protein
MLPFSLHSGREGGAGTRLRVGLCRWRGRPAERDRLDFRYSGEWIVLSRRRIGSNMGTWGEALQRILAREGEAPVALPLGAT